MVPWNLSGGDDLVAETLKGNLIGLIDEKLVSDLRGGKYSTTVIQHLTDLKQVYFCDQASLPEEMRNRFPYRRSRLGQYPPRQTYGFTVERAYSPLLQRIVEARKLPIDTIVERVLKRAQQRKDAGLLIESEDFVVEGVVVGKIYLVEGVVARKIYLASEELFLDYISRLADIYCRPKAERSEHPDGMFVRFLDDIAERYPDMMIPVFEARRRAGLTANSVPPWVRDRKSYDSEETFMTRFGDQPFLAGKLEDFRSGTIGPKGENGAESVFEQVVSHARQHAKGEGLKRIVQSIRRKGGFGPGLMADFIEGKFDEAVARMDSQLARIRKLPPERRKELADLFLGSKEAKIKSRTGAFAEWVVAGGAGVDAAAGETKTPAPPKQGRLRGWGKNARGEPFDLSIAAEFDDFVDVEFHMNHWAAIRSNGAVISNSEPLHGLEGVAQVALTGPRTYIRYRDGRVACRPDYPPFPKDIGKAKGMAVGVVDGIALLEDGTVKAWGPTFGKRDSGPPPNLEAVTEVAMLRGSKDKPGHGFALTADGKIVTWGNSSSRYRIPGNLPPIQSIEAGWTHLLCLTEMGTVICLPGPCRPPHSLPADLPPARAIRVRGPFYAAQAENGAWRGWGSKQYGVVNQINQVGRTPRIVFKGYKWHGVFWIEPNGSTKATPQGSK